MKKYIITWLIGVVIGGALIGFISHKNQPEEKIKIINETKTKTEFIKIPGSPQEYIQAYNSKFEITGKVDGDWFHVSVDDGYKHGYKAFELQAHDVRKNIIQFGYSFFIIDKTIYTAADISYIKSWNSFSAGGGIILNAWNNKQVYGLRIIAQYKF